MCDSKRSQSGAGAKEDEEVELFEEESFEFVVVVLAKHWEGCRKSFFSTSSNASCFWRFLLVRRTVSSSCRAAGAFSEDTAIQ